MTEATTLTYLDAYCERAGDAGLWAEPLNASTNLAFIIAALITARALRGNAFKTHWDLWALTLTLFSIGVGSGLWHLFATHETLLADVIPIGIFIHLFFYATLRRIFNLSWWKALVGVGAFIGISTIVGKYLPPDMFNGSIMYLPAISALALFTVALYIKPSSPESLILGRSMDSPRIRSANSGNDKKIATGFAVALVVFIVSILFRTIDMNMCASIPIGTHFMWHVFNAYVLYRLLIDLINQS